MKRLLTLSTFLLLSIMTFASTEVNGIYYEFSGTEATVVSGTNKYTGSVTIPASVNYGGDTYSVTNIGSYAFYDCSGLTSVTIPNSVTSIGERAFGICSGLISVIIPSSVTEIGVDSFFACSKLSSLTIPNSLTSIGAYAFSACSGLTSINVEEGNPVYDSRDNCNAIIETSSNILIRGCKNTTIPNSVTSIENEAFNACTGLTSIIIPYSVTRIGQRVFSGCHDLANISIPNNITSIESMTFQACSKLTSIDIPNSVTSIGFGAFWDCSGLTSIIIPNSVKSIGYNAFQNCSALKSVTIPNSVTSIGSDAFRNCSELTIINSYIENPISSTGSNFTSSIYSNAILYVPKGTINKYRTTDGWKNFTNIEENKIVFIDGICYNLFGNIAIVAHSPYSYDYTGDVIIPPSVIYQGKTYDVISIGNSAFIFQHDLTSITIPNSVINIGYSAFEDCSNLISIEIPKSVTYIDKSEGVFHSCTSLYSINVQEGNMVYDSRNNCNAIIETATNTLMAGCKNTIIPNSVTSIGEYAFGCCFGLASVTIPNSVTSIGEYAFNFCSGLTSVEIPNSVTSISNRAFSNCSGLTSIEIPNSVTSIRSYAFSGCDGLTSITIPNSVTSIGEGAFSDCSGLTSITIPNSVTSIGEGAFYGCTGLTSIYSYIEEPTSSTGSNFENLHYSNATLYVPKGTKEKYQATDGWKNFANIVEMEPTPEPSSDNTLAISNAEVCIGKQVVLPIDMNNVASIQAFQFDLYLPEGVTVAKDGDNEYMIELTTRAAKSHSISAQTCPDGAIRMVCTSMSGATFKGNEGAIVNVTLDVAPSMTDGDYDIEIKNIELSDGTPYNPADIKATLTVKTYTLGDVDGTGTVSVNDAVCVINYILGSPAEDFIEPAADLDGNGVITVNDVVILINDYILGGNSQNSLDLAFLQEATADDDYLYIEEDNLSNMTAGEEREIEVFMNTSRTDIQGLQCDIYLPDGMEFVPEEDGDEKYYADKGGRAAKSHSVAAQLREDGSVRVVETSTSGAKFKTNDLAVFYFTVKAKENMVAGNYEIKLANMELSYGGTPINPSDRTAKVVITDPSAINGINAEDAKSFVGKFIKDNKIIIMKHGKKHSVSGQGM